jgi:hypothetical protein
LLDEAARGRAALVRAALAPGFDRSPPRRLVVLSSLLLDFASWQALMENGFTNQGAATAAGEALVSLYSATRKEKDV